jgi:hypothetical protein
LIRMLPLPHIVKYIKYYGDKAISIKQIRLPESRGRHLQQENKRFYLLWFYPA